MGAQAAGAVATLAVTAPPAHRVTGEDLPLAAGAGLVALGLLAALLGASLWHGPVAAPGSGAARVLPNPAPVLPNPAPALPNPAPAPSPAQAPPGTAAAPAPAPGAPPAAAGVARSPGADCPPPAQVAFPLGSAVPDEASAQAALQPLVAWLERHPTARITVRGHADASGAEEANVMLSYRRATAVLARLHQSGIARERVAVQAAGSHEPVAGLAVDHQANRRAVVSVRDLPGCAADRN